MEIVFSERAKSELQFWKESGNTTTLNRIRKLLESIQQTPFEGIGKPELLKHNLAGFWSRRITEEHCLVYGVENDRITVYQYAFIINSPHSYID